MNAEFFPRVSEVVGVCYPGQFDAVPYAVLKEAQERGTYYHNIAKELMLARQYPEAHPFDHDKYKDDYHIVAAVHIWAEKHGIQPIAVETSDVHPGLRYKGTPDLLAKATNKTSPYAGKVILPDFKFTAAIHPSNHMQVVAYSYLPAYKKAKVLLLVQINPRTGEFKEHQVYRFGNGYWMDFCGALGKLLNGE